MIVKIKLFYYWVRCHTTLSGWQLKPSKRLMFDICKWRKSQCVKTRYSTLSLQLKFHWCKSTDVQCGTHSLLPTVEIVKTMMWLGDIFGVPSHSDVTLLSFPTGRSEKALFSLLQYVLFGAFPSRVVTLRCGKLDYVCIILINWENWQPHSISLSHWLITRCCLYQKLFPCLCTNQFAFISAFSNALGLVYYYYRS